MLPIRDDNPTRRTPFVNWLLIAACAYVYFAVQPAGDPESTSFLVEQATIPCEVVTGDPVTLPEFRLDQCSSAPGESIFPDKSILFSLVASIFLHGSIGHLLGNLWVLYIFGNNIEDELGHVPYTVFYLASGLVASFAHIVLNPGSVVPVVGASGAIAGVMGAYLVLHPSARVTSIVPPFFFWPFAVPAFVFLGIWFLGQFGLAGEDTNIAWEAHVGGFVFGLVVALWLRGHRRRRRQALERADWDPYGYAPSHGPTDVRSRGRARGDWRRSR